MKKIFNYSSLIAVLALLVFVSCQEQPTEPENSTMDGSSLYKGYQTFTSDGPVEYDLFAGQHILVGKVIISNDDVNLTVTFDLFDSEWCLEETHLAVATTLDGIPQTKKGNPIPGQFEYSNSDLGCVDNDTYTIPLSSIEGFEECGDPLIIAAHAVVLDMNNVCDYESDLPGFEAALPGQVAMKVAHPGSGEGDPSYFDVTISGGSVLDGIYDNWCVDTDNTISPGSPYTANVYSSYESLPEGLVDIPENLDLVNWILNQGYVGQTSPGGFGTYTYGDVQRAIWELIEDSYSTSGLGPWSQDKVNEIKAAALETGDGFVPDCGEVIGVILAPVNGAQVLIAQVTVGEVVVPCIPIYCEDETAWGDGPRFTKKGNWATYIDYTTECCFGIPNSEDILINSEETQQGLRRNGTAVNDNRSDPESIKILYDKVQGGLSTGFFSLGFGGSLVFSFDCPVVDGEGDDLVVYETTNGNYPLEQAKVFAWSGGAWKEVGIVDNDNTGFNRPGGIDLAGSGVSEATTFKITDITNASLFNSRPDADAYDVQYVEALNGACCD